MHYDLVPADLTTSLPQSPGHDLPQSSGRLVRQMEPMWPAWLVQLPAHALDKPSEASVLFWGHLDFNQGRSGQAADWTEPEHGGLVNFRLSPPSWSLLWTP